MRHWIAALIVGLLPLSAAAQAPAARPPAKAPAKAAPAGPEIYTKLYELGYPAAGQNRDLGVSQWRSRTGRKTIGALNAEEVAAIQQETMPTTFGAYVGDAFQGYGVVVGQKSRADAAAMALDECRKSGGPTCDAGKQIVFAGTRCLALAGYKDQIGADGKTYTAFSPSLGDTAEIASATAVRNCASDADGKTHCKRLFVYCANNATPASPSRPQSQAVPAQTPAQPSPAHTPASQTPASQTPASQTPPAQTPPTLSPPAPPPMADVAGKLFELGFPVSGKISDDPAAAISQWRFRTTGNGSRSPLTLQEIIAIMATPVPSTYGAIAGNVFTGFGLASQSASRIDAEAEAVTRCQQAKGTDCEKSPPVVVAGLRCLAYAGYSATLKSEGKRKTVLTNGFGEDPAAALQSAMANCTQEHDSAPHCRHLVVVCADGRQNTGSAPPAKAPPAPDAPALPPPVTRTSAPVRPRAEIMNKLFELGYPVAGKPYGDPTIAIAQWREIEGRLETGDLTEDEITAILRTETPKAYLGFAGSPLDINGLATQRDTRAKAEVDAVAMCRQKRGACDFDAYVVADNRCLAFAGYRDETGAKPRTFFVGRVGVDQASATARAMARCAAKPADAALCQVLQVVCGDGSKP